MSIYIINRLVFITEILSYTAQWPLHVPPGLTIKYSSFCPHSVFVCFLWILKQAAIILSTLFKYHTVFSFFLTLFLIFRNKYIREFTLNWKKFNVYADYATVCGQMWFGSINRGDTFSFPICPFSLSHHVSYPVQNLLFVSENSCQEKLNAHINLLPSSIMRGGIPALHNMSWRYFVEWSRSQSILH